MFRTRKLRRRLLKNNHTYLSNESEEGGIGMAMMNMNMMNMSSVNLAVDIPVIA